MSKSKGLGLCAPKKEGNSSSLVPSIGSKVFIEATVVAYNFPFRSEGPALPTPCVKVREGISFGVACKDLRSSELEHAAESSQDRCTMHGHDEIHCVGCCVEFQNKEHHDITMAERKAVLSYLRNAEGRPSDGLAEEIERGVHRDLKKAVELPVLNVEKLPSDLRSAQLAASYALHDLFALGVICYQREDEYPRKAVERRIEELESAIRTLDPNHPVLDEGLQGLV